MQPGDSIFLEARAKINLTLEILGTRPDGYHDLRSVLMPISLCDDVELTLTPASVALSMRTAPGVNAADLGPTDRNLAMRAALAMKTRYAVKAGVRMNIYKRIPIGGGLGGGSADAAGVIRGLDALWDLHRPEEELVALAAELGSDIPAMTLGGAVLMEGRGERVHRLALESDPGPFNVVVANPGVHCSTPEIFRRWKAGLTTPCGLVHTMATSIRAGDVRTAAKTLHNGLEHAVYGGWPEVEEVSVLLKEAGCLGVLLSGSGASVFGLAENGNHAEEISRRLDASGVWHVTALTCPRYCPMV